EAYDAFKSIIIQELARENEKEGPEQSREGQEQTREGILSSAGTVLGRAITSTVKALKKINDKIEDGAKRAADEYDKEQAKLQEQGAVPAQELAKQQRKEDVSQESEETLKHEDAAQKQQGPKTKEEALAKLREALDKYNEDRNDLDKWRKYWNALHEPILKDFAKKYFENGEKLQKNGAGEDALYKQAVEMIDNELGKQDKFNFNMGQQRPVKQPDKKQQNKFDFNMGQKSPVEQPAPQETPHTADLSKKQEAKDIAPEMKREEHANDQKPQTKAEALQKLKEELAKYDAMLWAWGYPDGSYAERRKYAEDTGNSYWNAYGNPLLHDFEIDFFKKTRSSNPGEGLRHYMLNEMIKQELAKETGQKIEPGPQDAKIKALADILGMVNHDYEDNLGYDKIKSAVQKMAEDKVISDDIVQDLQKIFDSKNYGTHGYQKVHDLEGVLMKHLYELESENEKQRQNGKGKTVEPKESQQQVKDKEQHDKFNFNMGQKGPVDQPVPQETLHAADLSKKQEAKDVSQKPADLMQREDVKQEKTQSEDMQARKQEVLKKIENSIMVYDNMFSNDFGEATHELDNLTKYINQSVKEGLISHRDGAQYRKMIEGVYGQTDFKVVSDGIEKMVELNDKQKEMLESKGVKDEPKDLKQKPEKAAEEQKTNQEPDLKTQMAQKEEHKPEQKDVAQKPENLIKREEIQKDKDNEKKPENKDLSQKPENVLKRDEAQKDNINEKKPENKDLSQKPENVLNREEQQKKNENKHKTENFEKGNQKVVDMDNNRDAQKKTLNQQALAAYRRKVLQGRSNTGNV
ncbi:MAG: hypothetical protein J5613_00405, partial [Alphaproteobacteria bacterium]|nr:hypothetical protein [Alphaproteobacteria bacterium]